MLHPDDRGPLLKMLRLDEVPADVEAEYDVWRGMLCRGGASGGLGPQLLIPLIAHLGYQPKPSPEKPEPVRWRDVPDDGSVRVQVPDSAVIGGKLPGVYVGIISPDGILGVRLDGEDRVRQFKPFHVQLLPVGSEHLQSEPDVTSTVDTVSTDEMPPYPDVVCDPDPTDNPVEYDGNDPAPTPDGWENVKPETPVIVNFEGDTREGVFRGLFNDKLQVALAGEDNARVFDPADVTLRD